MARRHRILSGIQPTGNVHLGNYLGALRHWVAAQDDAECFYCVVDLHALTVPRDPEALRADSIGTATLLLAIGVDPTRSTLFLQSRVPAHPRLAWLLECTAGMGELRRMTQFKDKAAKGGEDSARVGLFTYPTLMAADVLAYQATHVPVGDDQRQHLELTRTLAERFNTRYGPTFTVPEATIPPTGAGARVMDLQEPTAKMSKSADSYAGVILLFDEPGEVDRKIRRAVTDAEAGPDAVRFDRATKPGVASLLELLATATGARPEDVATRYGRYGDLKRDTADAVVELLRPLRTRYLELSADPGEVEAVLRKGAEAATEVTEPTLARAMANIGLLAG